MALFYIVGRERADRRYLSDRSLSFTARGIFATLLATVDDTTEPFSDLYVGSQSLEDRSIDIDTALVELQAAGYIVRAPESGV